MTTLASIRKRQGIPPPTTEAEHAEYERLKAERRAKNVVSARDILKRNGLYWTECQAPYQDQGVIFYVAIDQQHWENDEAITYQPEVGAWYLSHPMIVRFGCRNLVKYLKGEVV